MGNESNGHKSEVTRHVYSKTERNDGNGDDEDVEKTQGERKQKVISVPRPLLEAKSAKGVECVLQQERGTSDCFLAFYTGILSVTPSHWEGR